jgi:hypothetical protein
LKNTGTQGVAIEMIKVNENTFNFNASSSENTSYAPAEAKDLTLNNVGWQPGYAYKIEIFGNGAQTVGAYQANS